jgi:hypothetical protein
MSLPELTDRMRSEEILLRDRRAHVARDVRPLDRAGSEPQPAGALPPFRTSAKERPVEAPPARGPSPSGAGHERDEAVAPFRNPSLRVILASRRLELHDVPRVGKPSRLQFARELDDYVPTARFGGARECCCKRPLDGSCDASRAWANGYRLTRTYVNSRTVLRTRVHRKGA